MPSRYIRHSNQPPANLDTATEDTRATLTAAIVQCINQTRYPAGTVYVGSAGNALMKYHLSSLPPSHKGPNTGTLPCDAQDLLSQSDKDLSAVLGSTPERAWKVRDAAHISFLETNIGIAALALCRALEGSKNLLKHWEPCVRLLQHGLEHVRAARNGGDGDEDGCEVLYGRAGFLYALLRVRRSVVRTRRRDDTAVPSHFLHSIVQRIVADDNIHAVVSDIIWRGEIGAKIYAAELASAGNTTPGSPPLMWAWHGKRYIGAAHGVAGILQMLWKCPPAVIAPYIPQMLATVQWLVGCQDSAGNWPTKAPSFLNRDGENELVQWCHGAPGILILLSTIIQWSHKDPKNTLDTALYDALATSLRAGARLVYRHGLLRKGLGLCHGVAGSVFALLAASDALDLSINPHPSLDTHMGDEPARPPQLGAGGVPTVVRPPRTLDYNPRLAGGARRDGCARSAAELV